MVDHLERASSTIDSIGAFSSFLHNSRRSASGTVRGERATGEGEGDSDDATADSTAFNCLEKKLQLCIVRVICPFVLHSWPWDLLSKLHKHHNGVFGLGSSNRHPPNGMRMPREMERGRDAGMDGRRRCEPSYATCLNYFPSSATAPLRLIRFRVGWLVRLFRYEVPRVDLKGSMTCT